MWKSSFPVQIVGHMVVVSHGSSHKRINETLGYWDIVWSDS